MPPDNFQEHPTPVVAHRTSPTNIGLSLLSNFQLMILDTCHRVNSLNVQRIQLAAWKKWKSYKGHLYNWYDTETLQILPPRYISSVDSGNLAGHLLALRQGLHQYPIKKY